MFKLLGLYLFTIGSSIIGGVPSLNYSPNILGFVIPVQSPGIGDAHNGEMDSRSPNEKLLVFPDDAAQLTPVSLGDLIYMFLPHAKSPVGWDSVPASIVTWTTTGFPEAADGSVERDGLARVRVDGKMSTALIQNKNELAWSVSLTSPGPAKFGPTKVQISPGLQNDIKIPQAHLGFCFGVGFEGCTFQSNQATSSNKFSTKLLCDREEAGSAIKVFEVSAPQKLTSLLIYIYSEGSGGSSSRLEIHFVDDRRSACDKNTYF
jgi:hypothetical protein